MKDTIVALSGGLDSSSLLFEYKERIGLAVSFKYPSNHNAQELKAARKVAKKAGIPHIVVDVTKVFKDFKSALLSGSEAVPNADYNPETIANLVVPFRNGIFLSILAGLAESKGYSMIALANHSGDHHIYSDCRPEFTEAMDNAVQKGTSNGVRFFSPYVYSSKATIAKRGIDAGLNPDWTYSCYKGGKEPCGVCPTCRERQEALDLAR